MTPAVLSGYRSAIHSRSLRFGSGAAVAVATAFLTVLPTVALAQASGAVRRPAPTISVPEFKNNVTGTWWWQGPVAQDLAHALGNELASTGELKLVERKEIAKVLSEQELAALGIVKKSSPTAAQKGQMTGARYIILGTLTSYESNTAESSQGSGVSFLGLGSKKKVESTQDYVAVDIRVVDSTTGEIVGSRTVEGRATSTVEKKASGGGLGVAAGLVGAFVPMGSAGYAATAAAGTLSFSNESKEVKRTPVAQAIRAALVEASGYVSCLLVPKGNCMEEYNAKERQRRQSTLGKLTLE
ncbi:MAG: CsgG/HfaB family protein [Cyanobium sp.]